MTGRRLELVEQRTGVIEMSEQQQEWPPNPDLVVDVVLFADLGDPHVLLIKRGDAPFQGHWALPGGYAESGERLVDAAGRELAEETGVSERDFLRVGVYDDPTRDPRGHVVSVAFSTMTGSKAPLSAGDDTAAAEWVPLGVVLRREVPLAFDHWQIVTDAAWKFGWDTSRPEVARQFLLGES
jgi:8-oxo-dGTP diphosphatase